MRIYANKNAIPRFSLLERLTHCFILSLISKKPIHIIDRYRFCIFSCILDYPTVFHTLSKGEKFAAIRTHSDNHRQGNLSPSYPEYFMVHPGCPYHTR